MPIFASNSQNACSTCDGGSTTPPGAEFVQNNVPLIISLFDPLSLANPTLNQVAQSFNQLQRTITEIQTPVILKYVVTATLTYLYILRLGKGVYGGANGTQITAANILYLTTQDTSLSDIVEAGNAVIIELGNLPTGDYLTAANSEGRDLTDATKIYFFNYIKDGISYLVKVNAPLGHYGGFYVNRLTAANLIPSVNTAPVNRYDRLAITAMTNNRLQHDSLIGATAIDQIAGDNQTITDFSGYPGFAFNAATGTISGFSVTPGLKYNVFFQKP